jgi:hypothetical protein
MKSTRRRSDRPTAASRRWRSSLEGLETRQLLAQSPYLPNYNGSPYPLQTSPGPTPPITLTQPIGSSAAALATYSNEGKTLTGQDRQGDTWTLKLTGPGEIIVTDISPNDGVLDDELNTIQLVGTSLTQSVLTGTVAPSPRIPSDATQLATVGTLEFNSLIATTGVKTINLNGFILTDTVTPAGGTGLNASTTINLAGGVQNLSFEGIDARLPVSQDPVPINVTIGNPTTPLKIKPSIRIDHIYNTAYDDTSAAVPVGPLTTPTVDIVINGAAANLDFVSITQQPNVSLLVPSSTIPVVNTPVDQIPPNTAAYQYRFPIVGTTGRTAIQTTAVGSLKVNGSATNVTVSKAAQPFQNSLSGLNSLGKAQIGGVADAVALDVKGNIGGIKLAKGLGSPVGANPNPIYYGTPAANTGYPAAGLLGGQVVTEGSIGHIVAGASTTFLQVPQDPTQIQNGLNEYTQTANRPGASLTSSIIAAGGSIGKTKIQGDLSSTEIKSGFNYDSYLAGSEATTTGKSSIGPVNVKGNLTNSVVSASYRPNDGIYGNGNDTAGNGTITGKFTGFVYQTSTGTTALGNIGSGFYSRFNSQHKVSKTTTKKA